MLHNKYIKLYGLLFFMPCYSSQNTEIATSYKDTETKDYTNKDKAIIICVVSTSIIATTTGIIFDNAKKNNSLVKTKIIPNRPNEIKKLQKNIHKKSLDYQRISQSNEYMNLIELRDTLNGSVNTVCDESLYLQYIIKFLDLISKNPGLTLNTFTNLLETLALSQMRIDTIPKPYYIIYKKLFSNDMYLQPLYNKEKILINRLDQALFLGNIEVIDENIKSIKQLEEKLNQLFHNTKEKEVIQKSCSIIGNLLTTEDIENFFKDLKQDLLALYQENEYLYFDAYLYCVWKLTDRTFDHGNINFVNKQNNQIDDFKKKILDKIFTTENKFNIIETDIGNFNIYYPNTLKHRIIMHDSSYRFFCWNYAFWNSLTAHLLEKCYLNKFGFLNIQDKESINTNLSELCFLFKKNREYYNQLKGEEKKQFLFKWFGLLKNYSITDKDTYNYSQEFNEFYNNINSNNDLMDNIKKDESVIYTGV